MKTTKTKLGTFVSGWTRCLDCNKRMKFSLRDDLYIITEGLLNVCKLCYWDSYGNDKEQKIIFRIGVL